MRDGRQRIAADESMATLAITREKRASTNSSHRQPARPTGLRRVNNIYKIFQSSPIALPAAATNDSPNALAYCSPPVLFSVIRRGCRQRWGRLIYTGGSAAVYYVIYYTTKSCNYYTREKGRLYCHWGDIYRTIIGRRDDDAHLLLFVLISFSKYTRRSLRTIITIRYANFSFLFLLFISSVCMYFVWTIRLRYTMITDNDDDNDNNNNDIIIIIAF